MDIEFRSYCMKCKIWVGSEKTHKCSTENLVVADKEMVGIVDRLYMMGLRRWLRCGLPRSWEKQVTPST